MTDKHVIEALGMARVVISDGAVVSVSVPEIESCPLARRFSTPIDTITPEKIKENMESRIKLFGMCTRDRKVIDKESFVLFGASELTASGLRSGLIDCAVICCDGAGTVIAENPELVQGIGGRMSGLVETTPYPEVIKRIEDAGGYIVDKKNAELNAIAGLKKAKELGYKKPAVTVAGFQSELTEIIREEYPETLIIAVHTSGVKSKDEADRLFKNCDLVFACASQYIREAAESALLQGGTGVPVYASSKLGKKLVIDRLLETDQQILVKNTKLPVTNMGLQPSPLI